MDNKLLHKEQCPTCANSGGDTGKDNMAVYSDGQTHCFSCGEHGFSEHPPGPLTNPDYPAHPKTEINPVKNDWQTEYRGDFYSLPDRKLRAETLEKFKVKAEKDKDGKVIKHHYPYHNQKGDMVGIKTRLVSNKRFFATGDTSKGNNVKFF